MYHPTLQEVEKLASQGNLVPVYREINADLETPVSAYLKIARPPHSFLLESVEGGERIARYSFIGTEPMETIKTGPGQQYGAVDPLVPIEAALSRCKLVDVPYLERFNGGAVGYLSYESVNYFEDLPSPENNPLGLPESVFMLTTTFLIFDHLRHKIRVVSHAHLDGDVERAYDDAQGITAAFNLNLLSRINRELGGRFDLNRFAHRAVYDEERGRVEMHLVSRAAQTVPIDELDLEIDFAEGETIHSENSHKYRLEDIPNLLGEAGFELERQFFDSKRRFSLNLARPLRYSNPL